MLWVSRVVGGLFQKDSERTDLFNYKVSLLHNWATYTTAWLLLSLCGNSHASILPRWFGSFFAIPFLSHLFFSLTITFFFFDNHLSSCTSQPCCILGSPGEIFKNVSIYLIPEQINQHIQDRCSFQNSPVDSKVATKFEILWFKCDQLPTTK